MSDRNLISFTGDDAGNIYCTTAGGDRVLILAHDDPNRVINWRGTPSGTIRGGPQYADSLKFSNVRNVTVYLDEVIGSAEDAVDINNRCRDLIVCISRVVTQGRYCATIKGQSDRVALIIGVLQGRGSESDFDLGNHSDQAKGRTKNVKIHVAVASHRPDVTIKHAWDPALSGVGFDVDDSLQGWFAHVWRFFKRIGLPV